MTFTVCGCTEPIASEAAAQRHANVCELLGMPTPTTGCRVTVWFDRPYAGATRSDTRACGEPTVEGALCERHYADRLRLMGDR